MIRRSNAHVRTSSVFVAALFCLSGCAGTDTMPDESRTAFDVADSLASWTFERSPAPESVSIAARETPHLDDLITTAASEPGGTPHVVSPLGELSFGAPFDCRPGHQAATPHAGAEQRGGHAKDTGRASTPSGHSASDLAKKSQNPVANLISLPIEININQDAGYRRNTQIITNIKPVVPQELSEDWLLVHRAIVPLIDQPKLSEESYSRSGLGDIAYQGYLVPAKPLGGKLIVGFGPQIGFPTATDDVLGTDQWTAGPAGVALMMDGPWVAGALVTNSWTFASNDTDRDRARGLVFQPFVDYNFGEGWYVVSSPLITADWNSDKAGDRWTVPVGVGLGRVFHIGEQAINCSIRPYYNVHRPKDSARWDLQLEITFLFPEAK